MPWTSRVGTFSHQNYLIENRENVQRLERFIRLSNIYSDRLRDFSVIIPG